MVKKSILSAIIILLIAGIFYLTRFVRDLRSYEPNLFLEAIPLNVVGFTMVNNSAELANKLNSNTLLYNDLQALPFLSKEFLSFMSRDSTKPVEEFEFLSQGPFAVSFDHTNGSLSHTFYFVLNNRIEEREVRIGLDENYDVKLKESFEGSDILKIEYSGLSYPLYCNLDDGLMIVSTNKTSVQNAILQRSNKAKINDLPEIQKLIKTTNRSAIANVFINFQLLPDILRPFFKQEERSNIDFLKRCGSWSELDLHVSDDKMTMVGFINLPNDSSEISLLFNHVSPSKSSIVEALPFNTSFYQLYNFGSSNDLFNHNMVDLTQLKRLDDTLNTSLLFETIDKEFALAHVSSWDTDTVDRYFIVKVLSQSQAIDNLNHILHRNGCDPITYFSPDKETRVPIYQGFQNQELSKVFGFVSKELPDKYFACHHNYLFFSNSVQALSKIIYDNLLARTLPNQEDHRTYLGQFSTDDNLFIFLHPNYLSLLLDDKINPEASKFLQSKRSQLSNFYGFGIQLSKLNDQMYVNVVLKHSPDRENVAATIWESKLDSAVLMKPLFVTNHNTFEKEILVQDKKNTLYHISGSGLILWQKPLDGQILGSIEQIDFYKNKKWQFAFNTSHSVYLIDRNGNDVEKYPISLASPATNAMAVFDYEMNLDYRFFIACEDRSILVLNKNGNREPGWKFSATEGTVVMPIIHAKVAEKDYIMAVDEVRHYILDRKGNERLRLSEEFQQSKHIPLYPIEKTQKMLEFVTCTSNGHVATFSLPNGEVTIGAKKFESEPFVFRPYIADKTYYLYGDKNQLSLVDTSLNTVWEKKFECEMSPSIDIYQFSADDFKIGVTDKCHNIYLLNRDGSSYQGFPLKGTSRYSIGFLQSDQSKFNLIVGGTNDFLFNYSIK